MDTTRRTSRRAATPGGTSASRSRAAEQPAEIERLEAAIAPELAIDAAAALDAAFRDDVKLRANCRSTTAIVCATTFGGRG